MPTGMSVAEANSILDRFVTNGQYPYMQLHTGDPGATGVNNVAGNATRKDIRDSWGSSVNGIKMNSAEIMWTDAEVNTTETYTHISFWSAGAAGACGGTGTISSGGAINSEDQSFRIPIGSYSMAIGTAT